MKSKFFFFFSLGSQLDFAWLIWNPRFTERYLLHGHPSFPSWGLLKFNLLSLGCGHCKDVSNKMFTSPTGAQFYESWSFSAMVNLPQIYQFFPSDNLWTLLRDTGNCECLWNYYSAVGASGLPFRSPASRSVNSTDSFPSFRCMETQHLPFSNTFDGSSSPKYTQV